MRDSSCLYNESDSYCHPTLCGIKMFLSLQHEMNLENAGHGDLAHYASYMNTACDHCEGCGYVNYNEATKEQKEEVKDCDYRHPSNVILPEPIESYKLLSEVKKQQLLKQYEIALKKIAAIEEDFRSTFGEEIHVESSKTS